MTFDIEAIKSLIVAGVMGFISGGGLFLIVKAGIKKLIEKLTGAVGALKDEQVITQKQHDDFLGYINERDDKLINKIEGLLSAIPSAERMDWMYTYLHSVSEKIDAFLNEEAGDDE